MEAAAGGVKKSRGGLAGWLRRHWGKSAAAAIVILLVGWFALPDAEEAALAPATVPVVRGDIESAVAASGTLEAGNSLDVGARVTGQLNKLHVKLGNVVSEGDLLAEIDSFIQSQRVSGQEASLEALEANTGSQVASLELSRADLERQKRLMEAQATTEVEFDRAELSLAQAEAALARHYLQIDQARASLEEAKAELNYTRITSPAGGTIVKVLAQEGQMLNAMQTTPVILQIGDLSSIRVIAKIPEADVSRLESGMEAYFTTVSGGARRWNARLLEVSPIPEAGGAMGGLTYFDALLEVDNSDGALLPGMGAKVFFLTGSARGVLKVPLGALAFDPGDGAMSAAGQFAMRNAQGSRAGGRQWGGRGFRSGNNPWWGGREVQSRRFEGGNRDEGSPARPATVQVVDSEGAIETREVQIGFSNNVEAEVMSGLSEGERVVSGVNQPATPDMNFRGFGLGRVW